MILRANSKISIRDKEGKLIKYQSGDTFEVSNAEAERLIKLNVAQYEGESQEENEDDAEELLSEVALKKLDKPGLVKYAASLGLTLEMSLKKEDLVNAILDFMEEQAEEE